MKVRFAVATFSLAMVAVVGALVSCGPPARPPTERVPASYRDVRESAGHTKHLGKVACVECHGPLGFEQPPATVCASCHAKTTPLHHDDPTAGTRAPHCTDCHAFGKDKTVEPWNCMRCHAQPQNHIAAVGAHSDEKCSDCHQPHASPATSPRQCTDCHADRETKHAGLRGCLDCHSMHEPTRAMGQVVTLGASTAPIHAGAIAGCARCHATQPGKLHVDNHALSVGHIACTTCHIPHDFKPRACTDCHGNQPMIAPQKHSCIGCHDQHDAGRARACATCHAQKVPHPNATKAVEGNCVGCHPPHDRGHLAQADHHAAVACATCHNQHPSHAKAQCLDCHVAHGPKPQLAAALCGRCHQDKAQSTADTGHAKCLTCHTTAAHAPELKPPGCPTCHTQEAATAPKGHADCANCHTAHSPKPTKACASCHQTEGASPHGTKLACTTCHRVHAGPAGPAKPPACLTCHTDDKRKGLHAVVHHRDCATCHAPHGPSRDDRATCISCHKDKSTHQPAAVHCATCHPFK
jgi:hypothetical protein